MAWLIMNDEVDYSSEWYPTHMIDKDSKVVPVFMGAASTLINGLLGIYIRDCDYHRIRHDKAYIFIHDPDVTDDDVENVNWDEVEDVEDQKTVGRVHYHLMKEREFGQANSEGGNA